MKYLIIVLLFVYSHSSLSYTNEHGHGQLMALGHELLKQCGFQSLADRYSENDINAIILGSTSVDYSWNPFGTYNRLLDWHFYKAEVNAEGHQNLVKSRSFLADRTFIDPWEELHELYPIESDRIEKLTLLGGYAHFIEDMANPAHVLPAFHMVGIKDGIDDFPSSYYGKSIETIQFDQSHMCKRLKDFDRALKSNQAEQNIMDKILHEAANTTKRFLKTKIPHCDQFSWADFYMYPADNEFWGDFYKNPVKTVHRHKDKQFQKHTFSEKVVIGYEGILNFGKEHLESCAFTKSSYQPFVDHLFENGIIYDAATLMSQSKKY